MNYYQTESGYFYKIYKNRKKKRVSRKEYMQNGGIPKWNKWGKETTRSYSP